jgi:hypothetical protein
MSESLQGLSEEDRRKINQLFHESIKEDITTHNIQSIVLAHQHFVSSEMFLVGIVWLFHTVDEIAQFRILKLVKKWIELFRSAFQSTNSLGRICRTFHEFLGSYKPDLVKFLQSSLERDTLMNILNNNNNNHNGEGESHLVYRKECETMWILPTPMPLNNNSPSFLDLQNGTSQTYSSITKKLHHYFPLSQYHPHQVAASMTLRDHALIVCIDSNEYLKAKWTLPSSSPTLKTISDRVNRLCYWTTYQISSCPSVKIKIKIIDFLLKVAERLIELHSFNSLFAIYLGMLNMNN